MVALTRARDVRDGICEETAVCTNTDVGDDSVGVTTTMAWYACIVRSRPDLHAGAFARPARYQALTGTCVRLTLPPGCGVSVNDNEKPNERLPTVEHCTTAAMIHAITTSGDLHRDIMSQTTTYDPSRSSAISSALGSGSRV
jgi:hypothetical protein